MSFIYIYINFILSSLFNFPGLIKNVVKNNAVHVIVYFSVCNWLWLMFLTTTYMYMIFNVPFGTLTSGVYIVTDYCGSAKTEPRWCPGYAGIATVCPDCFRHSKHLGSIPDRQGVAKVSSRCHYGSSRIPPDWRSGVIRPLNRDSGTLQCNI